jgi:hypothetical protein
MTKDQLAELSVRFKAHEKAGRALRRALVDILPVGSGVSVKLGAGTIRARVTGHALDAPMVHAESSLGTHRLYAADILTASVGEA